MLKNYLLITLRSLLKNKVYIVINVLGLGIAIACCIVAYLNRDFDEKQDIQHVNAASIYRIQFWRDFQGQLKRYGTTPMPLADIIRHNQGNVEAVVRFVPGWNNIRIGDEMFASRIAYADTSFFSVFTLPMKYGSVADFKDKTKMFISDEMAMKYFNREDVVGQPITRIIDGKLKEYVVGGVFHKLPQNSSFVFEAIMAWDNLLEIKDEQFESNWREWNVTFLYIKNPAQVASVTRELQKYVELQNKTNEDFKIKEYYLDSFKGNAQRSRIDPLLFNNWLRSGMPPSAVNAPAIMAVLLLLLACFNFTNTSIAVSSRRLKEIGVRKVLGSRRRNLVLQFMSENLLLCAFAMLVGLALAEVLVPAYDSLWPWLELNLSYTDNLGFILFLFSLLFITAIIAGSYPSFYITSFEPVEILKGKLKLGGTNLFTRILLCLQFVISLMAIVMGVGFYENAKYQKNYDLGYASSGVISVWIGGENDFNTYRDALASNKDIKVIAGTKNHVVNGWSKSPVRYEDALREVDIMSVGDNYLQAVDMKLVEGRDFQKDSETDRKESVIVSEEFVKQFGWKGSAIGKRLLLSDSVQVYVIGVIKNVYSRALWAPMESMMLRYVAPEKYSQIIVSAPPAKIAEVNEFMEKKWKEVFPNSVYAQEFIEEEMQESNNVNENVVKMFLFLGVIAALMSISCLFTLVSLNILKKMKEIGVRKVLGASIANIARVINFEFAIILAIASLLGSGLGYLLTNMLMSSIWKYYLKMNLVILGTSVLIMMIMAALAIGFKTISTASLNPVKTLRDE